MKELKLELIRVWKEEIQVFAGPGLSEARGFPHLTERAPQGVSFLISKSKASETKQEPHR